METGVVRAPDADWRPRLVQFLAHKGDEWRPQIDEALAGPLDDLATSFYVGHAAGELICQTMVAGARGVGILGHVFTRPRDRRKGAIRALLAAALEDCGGTYRFLTLGTGYDGPPYHIY